MELQGLLAEAGRAIRPGRLEHLVAQVYYLQKAGATTKCHTNDGGRRVLVCSRFPRVLCFFYERATRIHPKCCTHDSWSEVILA